MKNQIKKTFLILSLFTLSNCGFANNLAIVGNSLSGFAPHKYQVVRSGENSFPQNNKSVVSLRFKTDSSFSSKQLFATSSENPVATIWRKVNNDGTFSDKMQFTYFNLGKHERLESMIESGTYFLDGISFNQGGQLVNVGAFTNLSNNEQKGWDLEKKQPLWFSFVVKSKEELFIPDVIVSVSCKDNSRSCNDDDFELHIKISDDENKEKNNYKIGYQAKAE